ncbi:MAG: HAD-IA family hydrolase, partial [Rhodothermales bacterium]
RREYIVYGNHGQFVMLERPSDRKRLRRIEGLLIDLDGVLYVGGEVIGKPSAPFFHAAAADMGLTPSRTAMVGDDIESDVGGAQKAGLAGILVKTGMYRSHLAAASSVRPVAVVPSIADVPNLLGI